MALAPVPATGAAAYDPNKIIGSQAQVDDSVAAQVTKLASQDSALNQMARTEGLKAANRRGLLNSSMAVGASQDAVLQNVLPIAQQEAGQAFAKNQAAKAFEYGLTGQEHQQRWQTGERLGGQEFTTSERFGAEAFTRGENIAQRGWQSAENITQREFLGTQADLDRDLQQALQSQQIDADMDRLVKQIASTEGIEAANRALATALQEKDIQFRMSEGNLDRASAERQQAADIAFQKAEGAATRAAAAQVAQWNLNAANQQAAASMVSTNNAVYQDAINNIMANTKLSSSQRTTQLTQARQRYDTQMNLVEQTYNVDLKW